MAGPLCEFALARGIEPGYARFLIRNWHLPPSDSGVRLENWPWPVKIRVLGRFSVEREEKPLPATERGAKPLELLKALVALGGRGVGEAGLAEMLWPDADGDRAHRSLKVTVHRLRRLLGEDRIVWSGGLLSLDTRSVWVDAWALERALGTLESVLAERREARIPSLAAAALALYRGPYLRGDSSHWVLGARERLRAKFLRVAGDAAEALIARGDTPEALRCYEKALEVDPAAERFYQGLMRCHLDLGQRADGLAVYKRCREILARELALAPSPKTEALRTSLLSG
jgi:DNA-binding SARP family transcriptional activator